MALRSTQYYISLFSGGTGGLDHACRLAIPTSSCLAYVEIEALAAAILAKGIQDGALDEAPIWSDIRTFPASRFRGRVAGVIGGFPCTNLSVAGKQEGIVEGNASGLWFEYVRVICESEPNWVAIENVAPVLAFPNGGIVFGQLDALGFDAVWGTLRASSVGASHIRKRVFIFAWRRGFEIDWARSVVKQCSDTGVSCFVKQLGAKPMAGSFQPLAEYPPIPVSYEVKDKKGGNPDEWPVDLRVRQFPTC